MSVQMAVVDGILAECGDLVQLISLDGHCCVFVTPGADCSFGFNVAGGVLTGCCMSSKVTFASRLERFDLGDPLLFGLVVGWMKELMQ